MAIFRGPRRSIPTKPGEERVTFLREVASTLGCDSSQLDPSASMTKRYGVDELEVFEYMQIAEDIWHVELNPDPMTVADFAEMMTHFRTLESIMAAAEAAARGAGS